MLGSIADIDREKVDPSIEILLQQILEKLNELDSRLAVVEQSSGTTTN